MHMFGKQRKRRGLASGFGLALVAMLAFGAFSAGAAQATPAWHVFGKTLKERGVEKEPMVISGGPISIEWENGVKFECKGFVGTGYVVGEHDGNAHIENKECSVKGVPYCTMAPYNLDLLLGLASGGSTGVIETFKPAVLPGTLMVRLKFSGAFCTLPEEMELRFSSGSLGAAVGPEGSKLPLTGIPSNTIKTYLSESLAWVSFGSTGTQSVATGAPFGAW